MTPEEYKPDNLEPEGLEKFDYPDNFNPIKLNKAKNILIHDSRIISTARINNHRIEFTKQLDFNILAKIALAETKEEVKRIILKENLKDYSYLYLKGFKKKALKLQIKRLLSPLKKKIKFQNIQIPKQDLDRLDYLSESLKEFDSACGVPPQKLEQSFNTPELVKEFRFDDPNIDQINLQGIRIWGGDVDLDKNEN